MRETRKLPAQLQGNAEWEAMKSSRRNLTHQAAIAECVFLSDQYRKVWRRMAPVHVSFPDIVRALQAKKIPFVLTGAHGIAGWTGRPRSTYDVDILVKSGRNFSRVVNALKALYPHLEVKKFPGLTAFFVPGEKESVIDVAYPHRDDNIETLRTAVWIEEGDLKYRIPTLEAALANKYGAMLTPTRSSIKRAQDAVDFSLMVKHSLDEGRQPINLEVLRELGEKVWPGGGGEEILRLVEDAKAGIVPNLSRPPA